MTDRNEIKAEIFRRSETRIRAIRRRRTVILTSVPVLICAVALAVTSVTLRTKDITDESAFGNYSDGLVNESLNVELYTAVSVIRGGQTVEVTDAGSVETVLEIVTAALDPKEEADYGNEDIFDGELTVDDAEIAMPKKNAGVSDNSTPDPVELEIIIRRADGTETNLKLCGNVLSSDGGVKYTLTESEKAALYGALGIDNIETEE